MRFIVDECMGPTIAAWLRAKGHDVFSVYDQARGMKDPAILRKGFEEKRILLTQDSDYGVLVFRDKLSHSGVIYLRLRDQWLANKMTVLEKFLQSYSDQIEGRFVVVSETSVRFASTRQELE